MKSFEDAGNLLAKTSYTLALRSPALERVAWTPGVPPALQIEPTNYCNLRCTTCSASRAVRGRGYMDFGLFDRIVSEASAIGVKRVYLYLHGEPFLHPRILDMVSLAKSKGLALRLSTNAMMLGPEMIAGLSQAGLNNADVMTISILGHSKETQEKIMVGIDHDRAVANALELSRLRSDHRPRPVIQTVFHPMPENVHELDDYLQFWRGKVDHVRIGHISESFAEYKNEGVELAPRSQPCKYLRERLYVFWNGDVPLCSADMDGDWLLGNLSKDSIKDVWGSELLTSVMKMHRDGQPGGFPLCATCDL